jgi:hypothetical protein
MDPMLHTYLYIISQEYSQLLTRLKTYHEHHVARIKEDPQEYRINREDYEEFICFLKPKVRGPCFWNTLATTVSDIWISRIESENLIIPPVVPQVNVPKPKTNFPRLPIPADWSPIAPTGLVRTWRWFMVTNPQTKSSTQLGFHVIFQLHLNALTLDVNTMVIG